MPHGLFYSCKLDESNLNLRGVWFILVATHSPASDQDGKEVSFIHLETVITGHCVFGITFA